MKCYDVFNKLYKENEEFKNIVDKHLHDGIYYFPDELWNKIKEMNFYSEYVKDFYDVFVKGYNIGNCVNTAFCVSYLFDDVDIVSGVQSFLKGQLNSEKVGGHVWLETKEYIIDTSLMLMIDKELKDVLKYHDEQRITCSQLKKMDVYQARKEFANDASLKK